MKITASGGLVRIAGESDVAANEERAASFPVEDRRNDATAGWDPYQVWLTRVKAPREARDELDSPEPTP
ncbi:MAG TPA: hypothetical protein VEZ88_09255 [Steroidobacteraceae bacterium]|nr:hypothetical protein [Steroidobacteraceae bacterium]